MVLGVARESARQGRRDDVEEADRLHVGQRTPRVLCAEYPAREDGLRGQDREDLVGVCRV